MAKDKKKMTVYLTDDQYNFVMSWVKSTQVGRSQFLQAAISSFVGDLQTRYNDKLRQLIESNELQEVQDNEQGPRIDKE